MALVGGCEDKRGLKILNMYDSSLGSLTCCALMWHPLCFEVADAAEKMGDIYVQASEKLPSDKQVATT